MESRFSDITLRKVHANALRPDASEQLSTGMDERPWFAGRLEGGESKRCDAYVRPRM